MIRNQENKKENRNQGIKNEKEIYIAKLLNCYIVEKYKKENKKEEMMAKNVGGLRFIQDADLFFQGAIFDSTFIQTGQKLQQEAENLFQKVFWKRARVWSVVAHKMVGSE